ncbi:MAG TPA: PfkB family carbohydrate kinase, partial [Streptosporangiaceae bacterium]
VPVIDTTGCGDAFDAGFITALLTGCDYEQAAWLAVACGSLVATGLGSDAGLTSLGTALDLLGRTRPDIAASIRALAEAPAPA